MSNSPHHKNDGFSGVFPLNLIPRVVFEDTHLIVLDKPAGLLSQGEHTGDCNVVDWLRGHFGRHYVGLIHRLDRNTSGLIVAAKRTKAAQRLTSALQDGTLQRIYLAWITGTMAGEARWEHWLVKDERQNLTRALAARAKPAPDAKRAALRARPIARGMHAGNPLTLAEFELETGRSHQIRAQAAAEGHALLGDRKYSGRDDGFSRPALHSHRLVFPHPMGGARLEFEAPMPADLAGIARAAL